LEHLPSVFVEQQDDVSKIVTPQVRALVSGPIQPSLNVPGRIPRPFHFWLPSFGATTWEDPIARLVTIQWKILGPVQLGAISLAADFGTSRCQGWLSWGLCTLLKTYFEECMFLASGDRLLELGDFVLGRLCAHAFLYLSGGGRWNSLRTILVLGLFELTFFAKLRFHEIIFYNHRLLLAMIDVHSIGGYGVSEWFSYIATLIFRLWIRKIIFTARKGERVVKRYRY